MILRISAENFELSEDLAKYAHKKLDGLERHVPRKARATTLIEATFSEQGGAQTLKTCQVLVKLRREELIARETTQHMYASLDVAVADLELQLQDYKKRLPTGPGALVRRALKR